ncbi:AraC family transcriptional regulator [Nodularia sphaerocarpa]|uniref:AraC family transcriptional regulator n=1 Tax=Nodularia sphaerocarpa TaxID=137816 RepID=UPI001EFBA55B|nr:AraC family transcriptional regulator [Nodularia sphaerocarpa]MDB9375975.1 AraC family transcriptional regulator [Nodularia sphaerocarpa CS-585]MDB9377147.1 AraC family transcriptional regulator [Nodularia sphaerocarpa CS-585A2]ULP74656.1 Regulatory protein PchR [Nodularia sphaerocarpa UHCC 0038]
MTKIYIYKDADLDELWDEGLETGEITYHSDEVESVQNWQHPLKKGVVSNTLLTQGLRTDIFNFEYPEIFGHDYYGSDDYHYPINLVFRSSGILKEQIFGINQNACEQPGESYLFHYPTGTREIEQKMPGTDVCVRIRLEPHLVRLLSQGQEEYLPSLLKPFLETDTPPSFYQSLGKMTPAMQVALSQLLNCPVKGMMRRTYVEAKTLELITLQFARLLEDTTPGQPSVRLRKRDIECIYQARDILLEDMTNPPSLIALAQQVQLNERKLKQGFHQIFGTTVFGYLRDYRLEQACQLLMTDQMNVAEVSYSVGFANRSYFAAAFRKKFGINPSDYQAQWRKKSA